MYSLYFAHQFTLSLRNFTLSLSHSLPFSVDQHVEQVTKLSTSSRSLTYISLTRARSLVNEWANELLYGGWGRPPQTQRTRLQCDFVLGGVRTRSLTVVRVTHSVNTGAQTQRESTCRQRVCVSDARLVLWRLKRIQESAQPATEHTVNNFLFFCCRCCCCSFSILFLFSLSILGTALSSLFLAAVLNAVTVSSLFWKVPDDLLHLYNRYNS